MENTILNKVAIRQEIHHFVESSSETLSFCALIKKYESIIQRLAFTHHAVLLNIDEKNETLELLNQNKVISIENLEGTFSVILECYYTQKIQHIPNTSTNFLYNATIDQLSHTPIKELIVIPLRDKESIVALIWLGYEDTATKLFNDIVKSNIEHFGEIIKESIAQRTLPLTASKEPQSERLNILIVDDDLIILKFLHAVLKDEGFFVEMAHSGKEALARFKRKHFDLIFMDEVMNGGMHGHQAVIKIRALEKENRRKKTPILALTSDTTKATRELLLDAGVQRVLYKPIDAEKIIKTISEMSVQ
jgi:CheY-like chemotaxis protein